MIGYGPDNPTWLMFQHCVGISFQQPANEATRMQLTERTRTHTCPPVIDWWITSRCNLSCDFCYGPRPDRQEHEDLRRGILEAICNSRSSTITLAGGEPLVVKSLAQVTEKLSTHSKRVVLNTNGQLLDQARAEEIGIGTKVSTVGISVDGPNSEVHQMMRGHRADFAKTVSAARLVQSIAGAELKMATVLSSVNKSSIFQIADLVAEINPATWRIYQYSPRGYGASSIGRHLLCDDEFECLIRDLKNRYTTIRIAESSRKLTAGCFIIDHCGIVREPTLTGYREVGSCLSSSIDDLWRTRWHAVRRVYENKSWLD